MKNWKIPSVILILLIVAMLFRWSTISSQTTSSSVIKFQKDNWNGAISHQAYYTNGNYNEKLVNPPIMWIWSNYLTNAWIVTTGGTVLWLLLSLRTLKKPPSNKDGE